jgi:hypothetical protein
VVWQLYGAVVWRLSGAVVRQLSGAVLLMCLRERERERERESGVAKTECEEIRSKKVEAWSDVSLYRGDGVGTYPDAAAWNCRLCGAVKYIFPILNYQSEPGDPYVHEPRTSISRYYILVFPVSLSSATWRRDAGRA